MSPKVNSEIAVIGIDLGKNSFRLVGAGSALQPCQESKLAGTPKTKEHAMSQKLVSEIAAGGMGALRAQVMDRGGKATPAPQCAGDRAR